MIKKAIIGFFLGLIAFGCIYIGFFYMGNISTLRNRIQTYPLYTTIFFVSLVLIYMAQGGNKIFRLLALILILLNIFIIGNMFFRNNIGLNSTQFLILFGLILLGLAISYITHRIRYIFMGIVGVAIVFILLTGMLPLYKNIPTNNDFIQGQAPQIINQGGINEGSILVKNALGIKEIPLNEIYKNTIDLSQKTQISFISKSKTEVEKIFVDIGNGSFININPQSAITLEQSGNNMIMQILQGDIQYYTPPELSGTVQVIGKYTGKNIKEIQNSIRSNLSKEFEQKKEAFFIEQLGGDIIFNPTVNKIIKFFITTLYTISPKTYQENLNNYTNIQKYLGNSMSGTTNQSNTGDTIMSIIDDIMSQVKKGSEETKIKQWLK